MQKQRNIRKKRTLEEEDDNPAGADEPQIEKSALEDLKLLQKTRKRAAGLSSAELLASRAAAEGGSGAGGAGGGAGAGAGDAPAGELMGGYVKAAAQEGGGGGLLTEEQLMERYVEQEAARRLGRAAGGGDSDGGGGAGGSRRGADDELLAVPPELRASLKNEVSIPGMTTAITEVDIGREARLRKIEQTEAAKRRLLERDAAWAGDFAAGDDGAAAGAAAARAKRSEFVPRFGKQLPRRPEKDLVGKEKEEFERRRRYISERTPDPRLLKQQQQQQQR